MVNTKPSIVLLDICYLHRDLLLLRYCVVCVNTRAHVEQLAKKIRDSVIAGVRMLNMLTNTDDPRTTLKKSYHVQPPAQFVLDMNACKPRPTQKFASAWGSNH